MDRPTKRARTEAAAAAAAPAARVIHSYFRELPREEDSLEDCAWETHHNTIRLNDGVEWPSWLKSAEDALVEVYGELDPHAPLEDLHDHDLDRALAVLAMTFDFSGDPSNAPHADWIEPLLKMKAWLDANTTFFKDDDGPLTPGNIRSVVLTAAGYPNPPEDDDDETDAEDDEDEDAAPEVIIVN